MALDLVWYTIEDFEPDNVVLGQNEDGDLVFCKWFADVRLWVVVSNVYYEARSCKWVSLDYVDCHGVEVKIEQFAIPPEINIPYRD